MGITGLFINRGVSSFPVGMEEGASTKETPFI